MRKPVLTAIVLLALLLAGWWLTPGKLVNDVAMSDLPADLDLYITERERAAGEIHALIPGTEKRIRWQRQGKKTHYAVVYLPGFSATRQEIAPTAELVANALDANLFETRLAGHGRVSNAMQGVRAEDWLADAAEAIAIGARIGERVVVIGTSTGATLALAMAGHPAMDQVDVIVMISPNFAPSDPTAKFLTMPAGPLLARLVTGGTRSWEPHNEEQGRYWSTRYPVATVVEVMRLVDYTNASLPLRLRQSLLTFMSPADTVVRPEATLAALDEIQTSRRLVIAVNNAGDPSNHVLAGRILSPENTETIAAQIVEFVR